MNRQILWAIITMTVVQSGCHKRQSSANGSSTGTSASTLTAATPAGDTFLPAIKKTVELLNSVKDDAGAKAAAPKLRDVAPELGAAGRQHKAKVALLETSGQHAQAVQYLTNMALTAEQPEYNIKEAIERVALGPQSPLLRREINGILDAFMECESINGQARLRKWIESKKLRG